ncbi:MAG: hypothetical protein SFU91_11850 [Chloroherpetonaceae bacterium]|nr:hypothetical protein [Chloroherpetonaceae bacterium]
MNTLHIEIFTHIYDDDFHNVIETKPRYFATYIDDIELSKLEQDLYSLLGEGIEVSSDNYEQYSILSIVLMGDRSIEKLLNYLSKYKITDNNIDIYKPFSNIEFEECIQINTTNIYFSDNELQNIKEILSDEVVEFKIIKSNEICEKVRVVFGQHI